MRPRLATLRLSHPITGIADCCAPAASGQVTADPVTTLMKSRRRIAFPQGLRSLRGLDYSRDLRLAEWDRIVILRGNNPQGRMSALGH